MNQIQQRCQASFDVLVQNRYDYMQEVGENYKVHNFQNG
jgi:hypothetical protein